MLNKYQYMNHNANKSHVRKNTQINENKIFWLINHLDYSDWEENDAEQNSMKRVSGKDSWLEKVCANTTRRNSVCALGRNGA